MTSLDPRTQWFTEDRFGLFVTWGLYALAARHEWVMSYEKITPETYHNYFGYFDPDLFDPKQWIAQAKAAGMKYVVYVAKHHDGFCHWDTAHTDFKVTNTPFGRDVLREFIDAAREQEFKIGIYYSLIDWRHPDFPIDPFHPLRDHPEALKLNEQRDMRKYAAYMRAQVTELLTGYGKVDIVWFDYSYPEENYRGMPGKGRDDWESEALVNLVHKLQPDALINNRLNLSPDAGDFQTPEQQQPEKWFEVNGKRVTWEGCHTLSGSWGYHRDETSWKDPEQLIKLLIGTVSRGGNLLMNVGPTGRGNLDDRATAALRVYADWIALHARSIYGCTASEFVAPSGVQYTQRGNRLYAHLFSWPFKRVILPGLGGKIHYAQLLNDASEVRFLVGGSTPYHMAYAESDLLLELPVLKPNVTVPVVEIFLK